MVLGEPCGRAPTFLIPVLGNVAHEFKHILTAHFRAVLLGNPRLRTENIADGHAEQVEFGNDLACARPTMVRGGGVEGRIAGGSRPSTRARTCSSLSHR